MDGGARTPARLGSVRVVHAVPAVVLLPVLRLPATEPVRR